MRQHTVAFVEQLETWTSRSARVLRAYWQPRHQLAKRLDHIEHQPQADVYQRAQLCVGFGCMREITFEYEQQHLVADVEQIGAAGSDRVGDKRTIDRTLMGTYVGWHDRARWLKAGVLLPQSEVLVEDVDELPEVGFLPVAARSFALFDDRVDGRLCGP